MAVAPLFVADMTTLRARLRLSGVPDSSDAMNVIDSAVQTVRTGFYTELGTERVAEIAAFASTDTPTAENEVLRTVAEGAEVKWVRYELMHLLPVLFIDGSGQREQAWNDEGAFRAANGAGIERMRQALRAEIDKALDLLSGDTEIGERTSVRSATIDPPCTRPWPGHSVSAAWEDDC